MTHRVCLDSEGEEHVIWLQQRGDTCGPACIYMVECNRRLQSVIGGEDRIRNITQTMPDGYSEGNGTGAISALALTLNRISIPASTNYVPDVSLHLAIARLPMIVHIAWPNGGGHYAVAVKNTRTHDTVFLDPWYALVEKPQSIGNSYRVLSGVLASGIAAHGLLSGHVVELN